MSLVTIRSEIKSILDSIKAANNVTTVYDYPPTNISETPSIILFDSGGEEDYDSTCKNRSIFEWTIRVVVEKQETQTQDSSAVTVLLGVYDAILVELRKKANHTLNGNVHSMMVSDILQTDAAFYGDLPVFYKDLKIITQSNESIV